MLFRSDFFNTVCTVKQNRPDAFVGTAAVRNKWMAKIWIDGKSVSLGTFPTQLEAHMRWLGFRIETLTKLVAVETNHNTRQLMQDRLEFLTCCYNDKIPVKKV